MDIRKIAEGLIAELTAGAEKQKQMAEGVILFYNKMAEVSDAEVKAAQAATPTGVVDAGKEEVAK